MLNVRMCHEVSPVDIRARQDARGTQPRSPAANAGVKMTQNAVAAIAGGAMDLAIGAKQVWVMMTLFDREGKNKLVADCDYPLTGLGCVSRIYTDHGIFDLADGVVIARALFGITPEELAERVPVEVRVA